jgi:AraC-like DNA-binding protein
MLQHDGIDVIVRSAESLLGRWVVAHWSPAGASPLSGIVERIWYFEGTMTYPRERVFPDGRAELIVMLDEPHRDGDSATLTPFPTVCINGLRTRPAVVVAPAGRCRVVGVALPPVGASMLLRSPMRELVDVTIDVRDALGGAAAELGERCAAAYGNGPAAIIRAVVQWTTQQIQAAAPPDRGIQWACQTISAARGVVSMDDVASRLGLSRSRLADRFMHYVGLTPKRFARIVRFDNVLAMLGQADSIVDAASELSYYDQAHLYRDFTQFAGMTPGAFIAAERYPNSASLAEA